MSDSKHETAKHTIHSVGEAVNKHYAEFKSFAKRAEAKTDEGLVVVAQVALLGAIGVGLLILAMFVGDVLGIASIF